MHSWERCVMVMVHAGATTMGVFCEELLEAFWSGEKGYPSDHDSEDEIESVDNEMASFLASEKVGYGTNSLLKQ
nr:hypothetical protein [Tanacetum cinerariifolium]